MAACQQWMMPQLLLASWVTCKPLPLQERHDSFSNGLLSMSLAVPTTAMAKVGGSFGGSATLEKSKLNLRQEVRKQEPKLDNAGGGGNNGKNIFNGGGGGDEGGELPRGTAIAGCCWPQSRALIGLHWPAAMPPSGLLPLAAQQHIVCCCCADWFAGCSVQPLCREHEWSWTLFGRAVPATSVDLLQHPTVQI